MSDEFKPSKNLLDRPHPGSPGPAGESALEAPAGSKSPDGAVLKSPDRVLGEMERTKNAALDIIDDLWEKSDGSFIFDNAYLIDAARNLQTCMEQMIGKLNLLTAKGWPDLVLRFQQCMTEIHERLDESIPVPETAFVLPLGEIDGNDAAAVGGKFAILGEISNRAGIRVPEGFVITSRAFLQFMKHNGLDRQIPEMISNLDICNYAVLHDRADDIQRRIIEAEIPDDVTTAVCDAYAEMCRQAGRGESAVAVRNSTVREDFRVCITDRYKSALNVTLDKIFDEYRFMLAGQFTPRALFYYKGKPFGIGDAAAAVGVQVMVDAKTSGSMLTRDPARTEPGWVRIEAAWGLGSGRKDAGACRYRIKTSDALVEKEANTEKQTMLVCRPAGGLMVVDVPAERIGADCLSKDRLSDLADAADKLAHHFAIAQRVDWVFDAADTLFLLAAEPFRPPDTTRHAAEKPRSPEKEGRSPLLSDAPVIRRLKDMLRVVGPRMTEDRFDSCTTPETCHTLYDIVCFAYDTALRSSR